MPDRVDETGVEHYVVDSVMRKDDAMAFRRDQISEKKIVCAILPEHAKAPDFPDASSAHGHGRAEGKLHALQHIGDKNACCHLDRHTRAFQLRPQYGGSATGNGGRRARHTTIGAGDYPNPLIRKRRNNGPEILWCDADIAIADDEDLVMRRLGHAVQRRDLGVRKWRRSAGEETGGNRWIPRGHFTCDMQARIVQRARTEKDLVRGIVLLKEAFQMFGEI